MPAAWVRDPASGQIIEADFEHVEDGFVEDADGSLYAVANGMLFDGQTEYELIDPDVIDAGLSGH
jgi:hypothetical protein